MTIDLSKLTPAPWFAFIPQSATASECWLQGPDGTNLHLFGKMSSENAEAFKFATLARHAFDVMMRRGWSVKTWIPGVQPGNEAKRRFGVVNEYGDWIHGDDYWKHSRHDPFTALVEADKWYAENVEQAAKK